MAKTKGKEVSVSSKCEHQLKLNTLKIITRF